MKLMFASDIHGSRSACEAMLNAYKAEGAERLILLGDLLYHGPRNNLPDEYDPKGVIALLNGVKNELFCVRGNCDAEVDQMVLQFPIMADYALFDLDGRTAFITHGHLFNLDNLPPHKPATCCSRQHARAHRAGKGRHDLHQSRFRRSAEGKSSQELYDLRKRRVHHQDADRQRDSDAQALIKRRPIFQQKPEVSVPPKYTKRPSSISV